MDPLVSVCMLTFNHEAFIAQAIESVIGQKTRFSFEVIVGEDCSIDKTCQIVRCYQRVYPEVLRVVTSERNVGTYQNYQRAANACRGRYIAFCEGDDFWTDSFKLQKQVEFLEQHPQYSACYNHSFVLNMGTGRYEQTKKRPTEHVYDQRMIFKGSKEETRTCSLVARREYVPNNWDWMNKVFAGDNFMRMALTEKKPVFVMKEYMSCYRVHAGGSWSSLQGEQLMLRKRNDLAILCEQFGARYPDLVRFRTDRCDYEGVGVMKGSRVDRVRIVLRMLRYPEFVFNNLNEYLRKIVVTVVD